MEIQGQLLCQWGGAVPVFAGKGGRLVCLSLWKKGSACSKQAFGMFLTKNFYVFVFLQSVAGLCLFAFCFQFAHKSFHFTVYSGRQQKSKPKRVTNPMILVIIKKTPPVPDGKDGFFGQSKRK